MDRKKIEEMRNCIVLIIGIIIILLTLYIVLSGISNTKDSITYEDELDYHSQTVYHREFHQLNTSERKHIIEIDKTHTVDFMLPYLEQLGRYISGSPPPIYFFLVKLIQKSFYVFNILFC